MPDGHTTDTVPACYDPPTDDAITDEAWLAGAGAKMIAADDPRRFGPADGLTITERIKARNARLNAWRCAYHVAPGHPQRWQPKATKRPVKAPRAPVASVEASTATVRRGESRDAFLARMLSVWSEQQTVPVEAPVEREPITVEIPEAAVLAYLQEHDGNEVSRAMALAWCAADAAEGRA